MSSRLFLELIQTRAANVAIGPNTLRNQGARNAVSNSRTFLAKLNLRLFTEATAADFSVLLNEQTRKLQKALPRAARHWGTARKALNFFLRDALDNHYLCKEYGFDRLEPWLEVPLDRDVASFLLEKSEMAKLQRPGQGSKT